MNPQLIDDALFRDGTAWSVYVIDGGRARLRRIELGHMGEDAAEVTRGLGQDQSVVLVSALSGSVSIVLPSLRENSHCSAS